ncbi:hypothetical protein V1504DRAFT_465398 [Lipomyces starkeyi]
MSFLRGGYDLRLIVIRIRKVQYDCHTSPCKILHQPTEKYENLHRLDPRERWTWREEIKVVRKIDLRIMVWVAFMFMALQLDRGNISQAVADNMLTDLGFSTNDFNNGNSIFKAV